MPFPFQQSEGLYSRRTPASRRLMAPQQPAILPPPIKGGLRDFPDIGDDQIGYETADHSWSMPGGPVPTNPALSPPGGARPPAARPPLPLPAGSSLQSNPYFNQLMQIMNPGGMPRRDQYTFMPLPGNKPIIPIQTPGGGVSQMGGRQLGRGNPIRFLPPSMR